jgi:hypothetical protein
MISHILIDHTSSDINSFVIVDSQKHFWETNESVLEFVEAVVHETKMESTTDEVFIEVQSFLIHINSPLNKFDVLLVI